MPALKAEVSMFQWNEPKVRIPFSHASDPSFLLAASARFRLRPRPYAGRRELCCRAAESVENRRPLTDDQRRRNRIDNGEEAS
jgi:hypothetical protein